MNFIKTLLLLVSFLGPERADAHGYMGFPKTRNETLKPWDKQSAGINNRDNLNACGSVSPGAPEGIETFNHATSFQKTTLYAGGTLEVGFSITAAHMGFWRLQLCPNPGTIISDDCFITLERCSNDETHSPYLKNYPYDTYMRENSFYSGGTVHRVTFVIPSNLTTNHGILRWMWNTSNSCVSHPALDKGGDSYFNTWKQAQKVDRGVGIPNASMGSCGDCPYNPSTFRRCGGEIFYNCADVQVVSGNKHVQASGVSNGARQCTGSSATTPPPATTKPTTQPTTKPTTQPTTKPTTQPTGGQNLPYCDEL